MNDTTKCDHCGETVSFQFAKKLNDLYLHSKCLIEAFDKDICEFCDLAKPIDEMEELRGSVLCKNCFWRRKLYFENKYASELEMHFLELNYVANRISSDYVEMLVASYYEEFTNGDEWKLSPLNVFVIVDYLVKYNLIVVKNTNGTQFVVSLDNSTLDLSECEDDQVIQFDLEVNGFVMVLGKDADVLTKFQQING